eukprot:g71643.t1
MYTSLSHLPCPLHVSASHAVASTHMRAGSGLGNNKPPPKITVKNIVQKYKWTGITTIATDVAFRTRERAGTAGPGRATGRPVEPLVRTDCPGRNGRSHVTVHHIGGKARRAVIYIYIHAYVGHCVWTVKGVTVESAT